jgi:excinuclease ABC subunit A
VVAGNTVIVVEHEMRVVAASDWVMDIGPGAGEAGGRVVASGPPAQVARARESRTAPYLAAAGA